MEINPVSEDLIKQNQENKNALNLEFTNQTQDQRSVNKTIANKSSEPAPGLSNSINNSSPIDKVKKEAVEAVRIKNELLAINIVVILGIASCFIRFINLYFSPTSNLLTSNDDGFLILCNLLVFIFILRKTDLARKLVIYSEYIALIFYLIAIAFEGFHLLFILNSLPGIIFAFFWIRFFSSKRIKRHFA